MARIGSEQVRPLVALIAGALLGAFAGCTFEVNPDEGRFSCERDEDCGAGFVCIAQADRDAGLSGLCFAAGVCADDDDTCNGKDDDCNGVVDDVSWAGAACESNLPGVCRPGTRACESGQSVCVSSVSASAESCDGLDNDCDEAIDEDFDFASDEANCGACGNVCATGALCADAACIEEDCANGVDDDDDGLIDCDDPHCLARPCSSMEPEHVCGRVPSSWVADGGTGLDAGTGDGGLDPDAGTADGGVGDAVDAGVDDGGVSDGGTGSVDAGEDLVGACVPREEACGDGVDQDGDGLSDCEDPDCAGRTCGDAGVCSSGTCQ